MHDFSPPTESEWAHLFYSIPTAAKFIFAPDIVDHV